MTFPKTNSNAITRVTSVRCSSRDSLSFSSPLWVNSDIDTITQGFRPLCFRLFLFLCFATLSSSVPSNHCLRNVMSAITKPFSPSSLLSFFLRSFLCHAYLSIFSIVLSLSLLLHPHHSLSLFLHVFPSLSTSNSFSRFLTGP